MSRTTRLVLARKPGEWFTLTLDGVEVKVTLSEVKAGRARVLIESPEQCVVLRGELCDRQPGEGE